MASTTENPNEENIKCVVVGDNNVGKTRLVCARAYSQYGPNYFYQRYGAHHIPTVWANDHYRNDVNVLNKARDCIDGVNVSLRLWDTFGDHNKNRRFSYGRADVAIVCFSICDSKSLDNISRFWLPEVRQHCKGIPVLLVGCKIDVRFASLEVLNRNRMSLTKKIKSSDILYPEVCRQTATEVGCPYYESSVCQGYGIKEIFENAVRAALIYRRKTYLYRNASLKHVQKPMLQAPLLPPKPAPPTFQPPVSLHELTFSELYDNRMCADVLIRCHKLEFYAHKAILASVSNVFHILFGQGGDVEKSADKKGFETSSDVTHKTGNELYLVSMEDLTSTKSEVEDVVSDVPDLLTVNSEEGVVKCSTDHHLHGSRGCVTSQFDFVQSYFVPTEPDLSSGFDTLQLRSNVSEFAFRNVMYFCYNGRLKTDISSTNWLKKNIQQFTDLYLTSQRLGLYSMANLLTELLHGDSETSLLKKFSAARNDSLRDIILWKETYSDVIFHVNDGSVYGHKPFLVCGSEMMSAMLGGTFIESGNKEIPLPGTTVQSLKAVFEYVYTGELPSFENLNVDYGDVIELANRLCLTTLVELLENHIIGEFTEMATDGRQTRNHDDVVQLLEVAQLHNACNLAEWCSYYISANYNEFCKKCKLLKNLSPSNQSLLERNRWPPVWYIKDYDAYERACRRREQQDSERKGKLGKGSKRS